MVEDRYGRPKTFFNIKHIQFEGGIITMLFANGTEKPFKVNKVEGFYDDNSIYCLMIECKYQKDKKCTLQQKNKNEGLSINEHGVCVSFENVDREEA